MAAPAVAVTTDRTIAVSGFYRTDHGRNLQSALQAALDAARTQSVRKIVNYTASFTTNDEVNLTDKGFRIQDTEVAEAHLRNVELRNFGGA